MILNEFAASKFIGSFNQFVELAKINNLNKQQKIPTEQKYIIIEGFRLIDDAIIHTEKHNLTEDDWKLILRKVKNNDIQKQDIGKKSQYNGNPIIYSVTNSDTLYGILIEYFPKKLPIVVTAFKGTQQGIDNWFMRNTNNKLKRTRQGEAHSLRYRTGMLPGHNPSLLYTINENLSIYNLMGEDKMDIKDINEKFEKFLEDNSDVCEGYRPFYGDVVAKVKIQDNTGAIYVETCECFISGKKEWTSKWDPNNKYQGNIKASNDDNTINVKDIDKIELHGEGAELCTPIEVIEILDYGNLEFGKGVHQSNYWLYN